MNSNKVTLAAVGDISFGDYPFCVGYGVGSTNEKKRSKFIFRNIKHIFNDADIVFGNLETTLSSYGLEKTKLQSGEMRGDSSAIESLKDCKFNIVNIANNHTLQHGEKAFYETVGLLENNYIKQVGLIGENGWYSRPVILEEQGIKFGFLGYAFEADKYFQGILKYAFGVQEHIYSDIAKLRPNVDYLIISFIGALSLWTGRLFQILDWRGKLLIGAVMLY